MSKFIEEMKIKQEQIRHTTEQRQKKMDALKVVSDKLSAKIDRVIGK